jgi:hypothetical protein
VLTETEILQGDTTADSSVASLPQNDASEGVKDQLRTLVPSALALTFTNSGSWPLQERPAIP